MTDTLEPGGTPDLDLTPIDLDVARRSSARRWLPMVAVAAIVVAMGFVMFRTLGDTALFFYNADEAVERRDELADKRFRLQGTPFGEVATIELATEGRLEVGVVFSLRFEGQRVDVVHIGNPAEQFQPGVPVVLEGAWMPEPLPDGRILVEGANDGWHFASTDMVVKHDNEYRNDNEARLDEADRGGYVPES